MLSGDEEKSRDEWKKVDLSTMANMKQDVSTHARCGLDPEKWRLRSGSFVHCE
jgi:hypothetical protein